MLNKPFKIELDSTPTLVYIQKRDIGIGELYINGKKINGLQEIEITAATSTGTCFPELKIKVVPSALAEFGTGEK